MQGCTANGHGFEKYLSTFEKREDRMTMFAVLAVVAVVAAAAMGSVGVMRAKETTSDV